MLLRKIQEGGYSLVDLSVFFGTQWFQIYQGSDLGYGNTSSKPSRWSASALRKTFPSMFHSKKPSLWVSIVWR